MGGQLGLYQAGEGGCELTKGLLHIAATEEAIGHGLGKINSLGGCTEHHLSSRGGAGWGQPPHAVSWQPAREMW